MITLSGSNTFGGGMTITAGTLQALGTNATSTGPIAVGASSTLFLNSGGSAVTYANPISGAGLVLVLPGTGSTTSTLSGNLGGLTGTLEISGGTGGKLSLTGTTATSPSALALDQGR